MDVVFGEYNLGGKMAVTTYWSNYTQISNYTEYDLQMDMVKHINIGLELNRYIHLDLD